MSPREMVPAMAAAFPIPLAELSLGEDTIGDLLEPSARLPAEEVRRNTEYMRRLVLHMRVRGKAPDTERIEANSDGVVTSGNHRVLAAWLLRWETIGCIRGTQRAGWRVPLDERRRKALEELLGLEMLSSTAVPVPTPPPSPVFSVSPAPPLPQPPAHQVGSEPLAVAGYRSSSRSRYVPGPKQLVAPRRRASSATARVDTFPNSSGGAAVTDGNGIPFRQLTDTSEDSSSGVRSVHLTRRPSGQWPVPSF